MEPSRYSFSHELFRQLARDQVEGEEATESLAGAYHLLSTSVRGEVDGHLRCHQLASELDDLEENDRSTGWARKALAHGLRALRLLQQRANIAEVMQLSRKLSLSRACSMRLQVRLLLTASVNAHLIGYLQQAASDAELAAETSRRAGSKRQSSKALALHARMLLDARDLDGALRVLAEAEETLRVSDLVDTPTDLMVLRGKILQERGDVEQAERCFARSEQAARKRGDMRAVAQAALLSAELSKVTGDFQGALENLRESQALATICGDHRTCFETLVNTADVLRRLGRKSESVAPLQTAINLAKEMGDLGAIASSQAAMAMLNFELSHSDRVISQLDAAIAAAHELGDRFLAAKLTYNKASCLVGLDLPSEANELLSLVEPEFRELGALRGQMLVSALQGAIAKRDERYSEAVKYYLAAREIANRMGAGRDVARQTYNLALVRQLQVRLDQALDLACDAQAQYEELGLGSSEDMFHCTFLMAWCEDRRGNLAAAQFLAHEAMELAKQLKLEDRMDVPEIEEAILGLRLLLSSDQALPPPATLS